MHAKFSKKRWMDGYYSLPCQGGTKYDFEGVHGGIPPPYFGTVVGGFLSSPHGHV